MSASSFDRRAADWDERYRSGRTGWDRGGASPALETWLARGALAPCRILVPGSGRGHEVVRLAGLGFEVTAVDIAPSATVAMRARLAEAGRSAEVVEADLLRWEPAQAFEAVYEQTALCALAPADWEEYAGRLHRWLLPGRRLYALFMQTGAAGGPPYHCDLVTMRALFGPDRWAWSEGPPLDVPHPAGFRELGYVLTRL